MTSLAWIHGAYLISTVLFILGLKKLTSPATARRGNFYSALGMLIAIIVTLLSREIISYEWIGVGLLIGTVVGIFAARWVAMTAMPEMVALLNGFGGLASVLVGVAAYFLYHPLDNLVAVTILLSIIIGAVTFFGSMIAWAKLNGTLSGSPWIFPGYKIFNALLLLGITVCSLLFWTDPPAGQFYFYGVLLLASIFGILSVTPIGGADMPVVISLLNSFSGLAASAAGFVVNNILLVVAGALVGASGIILSVLMCKAMNRSLVNVLVGGFGGSTSASTAAGQGEVTPISAQDAYYVLEAARSVCFVPGYGLAVAQAQHAVYELATLLENNGTQVCYGIHPVAGRMPGHMNVLLAEASVPYEQLLEMDKTNTRMHTVDVCIVIGANDVVNLAARDIPGSPIYGMPIINIDQAKTVIVIKRSMRSGFSGVDNPLFFKPNTRMLFGDAKAAVQSLIAEFKPT